MITKPTPVLEPAGDELTNDLGQSRPFPTQALPPVVRDVVKVVSQTYRVPKSLAACCALGVTSAAIGKGLKVASIPGKTTPANLYIMVGVQSGGGKSLVFAEMTKPLMERQRQSTKTWSTEILPTVSAEKIAGQQELKRLQKSLAKTQQPEKREAIIGQMSKQIGTVQGGDDQQIPPTLVCENITSEALAALLDGNQECLASMSADARDVMDIISGRYRGKSDEGLYLKAFSEDPCDIRRTRRPPIRLDSPNLTCLWLVQPDKVAEMFGRKFASESGLLPRFLVCEADCKPTPIDRKRAAAADEPIRAWGDLIASLLDTYRFREDRIIIKPTARAIKLLDGHHDKLVERRNGDLREIESYVARWNEQAWRLALVLHAAQWGPEAVGKELSGATARSAIELANWFAGQQLAKLVAEREAVQQNRSDAVVKLCQQKPTGIKAKDLYRKRLVTTTGEAHDELAELEAQGILVGQDVQPAGGGKPSRIYTLVAP